MKIESVRQELTRLETLWRQANEKELPEEVYRVQAEAKREELKNLMAQFAKQQQDTSAGTTTAPSARGGGGFTTVLHSSSSKQRHHHHPTSPAAPSKQHYLPAKDREAGGVDPFAAMSRHRFGANH